jgi:hypothetical protein
MAQDSQEIRAERVGEVQEAKPRLPRQGYLSAAGSAFCSARRSGNGS